MDGQRVRPDHIGYVWRIFGVLVLMPFKWVIGSGNAWEEPIDENSFCMGMSVVHPCFGQTYGYGGIFRVTGDVVGRVLVLGGYGNFGKRIAEALARSGVSHHHRRTE